MWPDKRLFKNAHFGSLGSTPKLATLASAGGEYRKLDGYLQDMI